MPPAVKEFSEKSIVPIQLTLLVALVAGVWTLANRVSAWERDLEDMRRSLSDRWSFQMEKAAWREWERDSTKAPNVAEIREAFSRP